jgi:hypothetical protein
VSKQRKGILPRLGIADAFFNKKVQKVLEIRFKTPKLADNPSAQQEYLAWPIIAYHAVDEFVQERSTKIDRHRDFLIIYVEDRQFVADLLGELTNYHETPEKEKSLTRRISEGSSVSETFHPEDWILDGPINDDDSIFASWKTVAEMLDCKNSPNQLATDFSREHKRRKKLMRKWNQHYRAFFEILNEGRPLVPLQYISF